MKNDYEIRGETTVLFHKRIDGTIVESYISTKDLERVKEIPGTWSVGSTSDKRYSYIRTKWNFVNGKRRCVNIHRWITNAPDDRVVDHINHNTRDNRRENIRVVTANINNQNRNGANHDSVTGIRGLYWHKRDKAYRVKLYINGKYRHIGQSVDFEKAKKIAENAIKELLVECS